MSKIDPIAVAQNLTCFIEHYMGIFPNVNLDGIPTSDELINELFDGDSPEKDEDDEKRTR